MEVREKIISLPNHYKEYHTDGENEYYEVYIDDDKIVKCPHYYQALSESMAEMFREGASMENDHDEFGRPEQKTIDTIYDVAGRLIDDVKTIREIAINSLAEDVICNYDVVEITNKGLKKLLDSEFSSIFTGTNQGMFIVKLQENAKKYNKKLILH